MAVFMEYLQHFFSELLSASTAPQVVFRYVCCLMRQKYPSDLLEKKEKKKLLDLRRSNKWTIGPFYVVVNLVNGASFEMLYLAVYDVEVL